MIGMAWAFDFFWLYSTEIQKLSTSFFPLKTDLYSCSGPNGPAGCFPAHRQVASNIFSCSSSAAGFGTGGGGVAGAAATAGLAAVGAGAAGAGGLVAAGAAAAGLAAAAVGAG